MYSQLQAVTRAQNICNSSPNGKLDHVHVLRVEPHLSVGSFPKAATSKLGALCLNWFISS